MPPSLTEPFAAILSSLGTPYPAEVGPPAWVSPSAHLSNLLRNGPRRKAFLLHHDSGDYDYDEGLTDDDEFRMEARTLSIYKQALLVAEPLLGPGRGFSGLPDALLPPEDEEADVKESQLFDDVAWTESYEGGAVSHLARRLRAWDVGDERVCLQAGKWQGDGHFALFVIVTVTPRTPIDDPASGEDRPAHRQPPELILALQRRLGLVLDELPEQGLPDRFFPRNVMTVKGSYARNAQGQVTGLNLAGADLTDLTPLQDLVDLERLNLDNNALVAVGALARHARLRELSLRANLVPPSPGLDAVSRWLVHPIEFVQEPAGFSHTL